VITRFSLSQEAWRPIRAALAQSGQRVPLAPRAAYAWTSALFTLTNYFQTRELALLPAPAPVPDPLYVLGLWRSGTTLLHELLAADESLRAPSNDECMNPLSILGPAGRRSTGGHSTRPMDGVKISGDSPQEDEFALLSFGAESAYRAFVAPGLLATAADSLPLHRQPPAARERWLSQFDELLRRFRARDPRRLLLKSPNHTFRVRLLSQKQPSAQFMAILRHPRDTWCSNMKMWRAMTRQYGLAPLDAGALNSFLRAAFELYGEELEWMRAHLPASRYQEVRYEDLVAGPLDELQRVNQALGVLDAGLASGSFAARWETLSGVTRVACNHADCGWTLARPTLDTLAQRTGYRIDG
jgi:omega-hydroxy-beta-dihydromenaquinone-9 sulfotransferase